MTGHAWTGAETRYLIENYKKKSAGEIASYLGRSAEAVRYKAFTLGLTNKRPKNGHDNDRKPPMDYEKEWTFKELTDLQEEAENYTIAEHVIVFSKSREAIVHGLKVVGKSAKPDPKPAPSPEITWLPPSKRGASSLARDGVWSTCSTSKGKSLTAINVAPAVAKAAGMEYMTIVQIGIGGNKLYLAPATDPDVLQKVWMPRRSDQHGKVEEQRGCARRITFGTLAYGFNPDVEHTVLSFEVRPGLIAIDITPILENGG